MSGNTPTLIRTARLSPSRDDHSRFLTPVLLGVFPVLGVILALAGMTLVDIVQLLASCAGLGLLTVAVLHGGKRAASLLSSAMRNSQ